MTFSEENYILLIYYRYMNWIYHFIILTITENEKSVYVFLQKKRILVWFPFLPATGGGKMESRIVEQDEAEEAEAADPLGPNKWSNEEGEEDEEGALVFLMSINGQYM